MAQLLTNITENETDRMIVERFEALYKEYPLVTIDKILVAGLNCYERVLNDNIFDEVVKE